MYKEVYASQVLLLFAIAAPLRLADRNACARIKDSFPYGEVFAHVHSTVAAAPEIKAAARPWLALTGPSCLSLASLLGCQVSTHNAALVSG